MRELRKAMGLTQQQFDRDSKKHGASISRRTLQDIERNIRLVGPDVLKAVATVLRVPPGRLVVETVHTPTWGGHTWIEDQVHYAWLQLPTLPVAQGRELVHAIRCAMAGRADQAARICRRVLGQIQKDDGFEEYAAVLVKLVTFLDEAGRHREALKELEEFSADLEAGYKCSPSCRLWAEYHRGICLRRLAEEDTDLYSAAEGVFRRLEESGGKLRTAAAHQLGVVYLEQAARTRGKRAARLFAQADQLFSKAHRDWKRRGGAFREGFPLRRLGQSCALQGRYREALERFLQALTVFIRYHSHRYVHNTLKDIRTYVSARAFKDTLHGSRWARSPAPPKRGQR